jgi:hypothetical protein
MLRICLKKWAAKSKGTQPSISELGMALTTFEQICDKGSKNLRRLPCSSLLLMHLQFSSGATIDCKAPLLPTCATTSTQVDHARYLRAAHTVQLNWPSTLSKHCLARFFGILQDLNVIDFTIATETAPISVSMSSWLLVTPYSTVSRDFSKISWRSSRDCLGNI